VVIFLRGIIGEGGGGLLMINDVASWLFNLMLWGAIITLAVLLYELSNRGFLADQLNSMSALIGLGVVAVVSLLWPKY
jgi:hypothetical protein